MDVSILLIEDDDVDVIGIQRCFKKRHMQNEIIRAKSGKEALALMKANAIPFPFIILLDLNMPSMDGLEFLAYLREFEKFKHSIVFVLTTSKSEQDVLLSFEKHVAGYFLKNEAGKGYESIVDCLEAYIQVAHFPTPI